MRGWLVALMVMLPALAAAQSVSMSGSLGDKALLLIDGTPRTVAVGATVSGVKVIRKEIYTREQRIARLCFAKRDETLQTALQRLQKL